MYFQAFVVDKRKGRITYYAAEKFEQSFGVLHGFREAGRSVSASDGDMVSFGPH